MIDTYLVFYVVEEWGAVLCILLLDMALRDHGLPLIGRVYSAGRGIASYILPGLEMISYFRGQPSRILSSVAALSVELCASLYRQQIWEMLSLPSAGFFVQISCCQG